MSEGEGRGKGSAHVDEGEGGGNGEVEREQQAQPRDVQPNVAPLARFAPAAPKSEPASSESTVWCFWL